jgi:hypothetical protein
MGKTKKKRKRKSKPSTRASESTTRQQTPWQQTIKHLLGVPSGGNRRIGSPPRRDAIEV